MPEQAVDRSQWDTRADGSAKGDGFLGILVRPDGRVSTEISIGTEDVIPGKETEIPTIVPTLTPHELDTLLRLQEGTPIPRAIAIKAVDYARQRVQQMFHVHPEFPRVDVPTTGFNDAAIRPMASHPTLASLGQMK